MKESKFKIGDEIFYMGVSEPKKNKITGIVKIEGKVETTSLRQETKPGEIAIMYSVGCYTLIEEKDTYSSKEELINAVFSKI